MFILSRKVLRFFLLFLFFQVTDYQKIFAEGKSEGGIGISVFNSQNQRINKSIPILIEVWNTDGDSQEMNIKIRLNDGLKLKKGKLNSGFPGPILRYKRKKFYFSVISNSLGEKLIYIDVSRRINGSTESKTVPIQLHVVQ